MSSLRLGVNVDHVATLRQARYATMPESKNAEPDLLVAARICERAGAGGIVAHLRSDRRHIQDHDIVRLRQNIMTKLNLEMGNTEEIIDVALRIKPEEVCLVPEKREEITTEGGLDVRGQRKELEPTVRRLQVGGIPIDINSQNRTEEVFIDRATIVAAVASPTLIPGRYIKIAISTKVHVAAIVITENIALRD